MKLKKISLIVFLLLISLVDSMAQCAMCRATIENNLSNGDIGIGAGLNFGILYLFIFPYLALATVGFFWYRNSRQSVK
jgi:hypothetical protein